MDLEHLKLKLIGHDGDAIDYQVTTTRDGSLEEWIRNVKALPMPSTIPGPHVKSIPPKFSAQIFVGEPGSGQIFFINFRHLNNWLRVVDRTRREAGGNEHPELQDLDILDEIAEVTVEENIHTFQVDQNPHKSEALGLCRHRHKIWTIPQPNTRVGTCECALKEYTETENDATN